MREYATVFSMPDASIVHVVRKMSDMVQRIDSRHARDIGPYNRPRLSRSFRKLLFSR